MKHICHHLTGAMMFTLQHPYPPTWMILHLYINIQICHFSATDPFYCEIHSFHILIGKRFAI